MKKIILFIFVFTLFGCKVGEFTENRNRLHGEGHDKVYCEKYPDRCVDGMPW